MALDVINWTNIPSPYHVERLNALADRGHLRFEVWFNEVTNSERSWDVDESTWKFKGRYVKPIRFGKYPVGVPWSLITQRPPTRVLASLYADPCFIIGSRYAALRGVKTMYWCEAQFDSWRRRTRKKDAIKRYLFSRVDAVHVPGDDGSRYAEEYGIAAKRVFKTPHVIDPGHYFAGAAAERRDGKVRTELGLEGRFVYLNVGRLVRAKGLEYLIRAFARVRDRFPDSYLLFVGDGVDEKWLRSLAQEVGIEESFQIVDFIQRPDLPRYYGLAGCFVFPSLGEPYGLVVDEAMAAEVPVVAATSVGEIDERLGADTRGRRVAPYAVKPLAGAMIDVRSNRRRTSLQVVEAARWINGRTPDLWAESFENAVLTVQTLPAAGAGC